MQSPIYAVVLAALFVLRLCNAETHNITQPQPKCGGKEKASTLLDVARDFMNKAKKSYPECINDDLNCGNKEKSLAFLEVASNLISESKKAFPICPEPVCPDTVCPEPICPDTTCPEPICPDTTCPEPICPVTTCPETICPVTDCPDPICPDCECPEQIKEPMDCSEIFRTGKKKSGVYTIWTRSNVSSKKSITVYCDMDTDGGGWTVIQRRGPYSTPKDYFYKDWENYKKGFGDIKEEFWLGNDDIHVISKQANYKIRFDLQDAAGVKKYAQYDTFSIEDETSAYTLRISNYTGNAGDSMEWHNNKKFSTKDRDNDLWDKGSCALERHGAWWYHFCAQSNLNGLNMPGVETVDGMFWVDFRKDWKTFGLERVEIKLRSQRV